MAPQRLGDHFYHVETPNGATWTRFSLFFEFWTQNWCSRPSSHTLGTPGGLGFPSPVATGRRCLAGAFSSAQKSTFPKNTCKKCSTNVEIEGVGPPWRDPRRNSA